jgi:hypothetical protein
MTSPSYSNNFTFCMGGRERLLWVSGGGGWIDGVLSIKISRQRRNLVIGNGTAKGVFHFNHNRFPFLLRKQGLSIHVICRMTDETVGIGDLLPWSGLEKHGIRGKGKSSKRARFFSSPGYLLGAHENGSCREKEEECHPLHGVLPYPSVVM